MTDACICCGATNDLRGVNLSRGRFTICAACRDEWEEGVTAGWRFIVGQRDVQLADARRALRAAFDLGIQREWQAAAGTNDDKENV